MTQANSTATTHDNGKVYKCTFVDWRQSVWRLLERVDLAGRIKSIQRIVIKPNLVEAKNHPVTTPVAMVAALVEYLQRYLPEKEIVIAEGTGATSYSTWHPFEVLGYKEMADRKKITLIDLNEEPLVRLENSSCQRWPEMYLPEIVFTGYLISVPVLKVHTLADVTLTMKNMMGLAPPVHYQRGGAWKKASFHDRVHEAVYDLNRYRTPDFTVLDATIGMQDSHLWGRHCDPPPNQLAVSFDPVAIDAFGAGLLGKRWKDVEHIRLADGVLGSAAPLTVVDLL